MEPETINFQQILKAHWELWLEHDPLFATFAGDHRYDHLLPGGDEASQRLLQRTLDGLALVDISTAQEILGRTGSLAHIDLLLPEDETLLQAALADLEGRLPAGAQVQPVSARQGTIQEMTAKMRSLLAFDLLSSLATKGLVSAGVSPPTLVSFLLVPLSGISSPPDAPTIDETRDNRKWSACQVPAANASRVLGQRTYRLVYTVRQPALGAKARRADLRSPRRMIGQFASVAVARCGTQPVAQPAARQPEPAPE